MKNSTKSNPGRTTTGLGRWVAWLAPVFILTTAHPWIRSHLNPTDAPDDNPFALSVSVNTSAAYLIVSKPQNSISISMVQQLYPATVFWAYPSSDEEHIATIRARIPPSVQFCAFDPHGETPEQVHAKNFRACLNKLPALIDGVIFNLYGAVGDGSLVLHPKLVQYKLTTPLQVLQILMDQTRLEHHARIVFVGSESARGLPRMGFPIPQLGDSVASIRSFLSGDAYEAETYRWEKAYGDLSAVLVLYVQYLCSILPDLYVAVVSPGMTEESFNADNSPGLSLLWRLRLWTYRNLLFGLLCRSEIAKPSSFGASLILNALSPDYEYASGTFVGALSGTGGPVGDQSRLPGGKMFRNEQLQALAYEAVIQHMQMEKS